MGKEGLIQVEAWAPLAAHDAVRDNETTVTYSRTSRCTPFFLRECETRMHHSGGTTGVGVTV